MNATERRKAILSELDKALEPISASAFGNRLNVSRQVIVQDIAILRAEGYSIHSLSRGYCLSKSSNFKRVFKVYHSDEDVRKELNLIVDAGGQVEDVFVYHKAYGTVRADMKIKSRFDVKKFLDDITSGKSKLLKNVTSGYHYHTITADSIETLDLIEQSLKENGFLAPFKEYEPDCISK